MNTRMALGQHDSRQELTNNSTMELIVSSKPFTLLFKCFWPFQSITTGINTLLMVMKKTCVRGNHIKDLGWTQQTNYK